MFNSLPLCTVWLLELGYIYYCIMLVHLEDLGVALFFKCTVLDLFSYIKY